jgi:small subunit ribosomal protein S13
MVRIAGIDLPRLKRIEYSLTKIYGIGVANSRKILTKANINFDLRTNQLTDEHVSLIREILENEYSRNFTKPKQKPFSKTRC